MKRSKHSDEQITYTLRQAESGTAVAFRVLTVVDHLSRNCPVGTLWNSCLSHKRLTQLCVSRSDMSKAEIRQCNRTPSESRANPRSRAAGRLSAHRRGESSAQYRHSTLQELPPRTPIQGQKNRLSRMDTLWQPGLNSGRPDPIIPPQALRTRE